MKLKSILIKAFYLLFILSAFQLNAQSPLYLDSTKTVEQRVEDLFNRMTLDEKIGQMIQVDQEPVSTKLKDVTTYFMGSVLSGGNSKPPSNTLTAWANLYDSLQTYALKTRLKIPILYGIDAVHGNNDVYGSTLFPHNIGLGCSRDSSLVARAARITAIEVAASGIDWTFAPCIAVPQDERWGRTYEGFGETPELAQLLGSAAVMGFQGDSLNGNTSIVACSKHFLGDGGTSNGVDQGNTIADEATLRKIHLPGYINAVNANVGTIMASYSSINGLKMHGNKYWMTDVLKTELGFKGFIISDWAGVDQVNADYTQAVKLAVNAGIDMVMLPYRYNDFTIAMKTLVNNGDIPQSRVDDAVKRILRIKFMKGLFEHPFANRTLFSKVGSAEHRLVAREAVRKSLVLLKKKDDILPFPKSNTRILVAGSHADDIGLQNGGWTVTWQGGAGKTTIGTTILQGMKKVAPSAQIDYSLTGDFANTIADYSVVVIGETPYAEGSGNKANLSLPKSDIELIKKMKNMGHPVVVILISGRPLIIEPILHFSDVIIAAWLPGTEGDGISDILFGDYQPQGLLSNTWPKTMAQIPINFGDLNYDPLFPYGFGITSLENSSHGSSPLLMSAATNQNGKTIELTFNKKIDDQTLDNAVFKLDVNQVSFPTNMVYSVKQSDSTTVLLSLENPILQGDAVSVSYISGNIKSKDGGFLSVFSTDDVYNWVIPPSITIPGKIPAEKFSDMYGVFSEPTTDSDGGMNLTSIDNGDWMEYFVNVSKTAQHTLSLRISSTSSGNITMYSGTKTLFSRALTNTGNFSTYATIKQIINLTVGEQILKINVNQGGFKLHWLLIETNSTGIEGHSTQSESYSLEQNYPNPFNPETLIRYSIKETNKVVLKVYNCYGQEVKLLVDETQSPSEYSVKFDGTGLSSGVYFYQIRAGNFSSTGKMLLMK